MGCCVKLSGNYRCFVFLNTSLCCLSEAEDGNLILGLAYMTPIMKKALSSNVKRVYFVAHHPLQNITSREDKALQELLRRFCNMHFFWLCGDAHENRNCSRDFIETHQVGSLTSYKTVIPDFSIYDIDDDVFSERIFHFLPHLNSTSSTPGGWKRVYI